ncbi:MAG: monovalent cation/H+ antiporter subunit D [Phenylobacterium sp.]|uniref:monovalent cation/H+ antiporter subunit D n=1 Tax=Phenylobacterium sp. TaxID=1871053 RepID=UPI002A365FCE|nr:monovalent cation/H+ antiporter subunit D [Phenylobacterium sp.]MDX9998751.1 monovalent cation/H+ antiporter subunit D [Phenylobacterium sp.]
MLVGGRRRGVEAGLALAASFATLIVALLLAGAADQAGGQGLVLTYRLGDWPTNVAIVLVADRLSALMVLLAAILGLLNTASSLSRWARLGPYYTALSQFLMMGLNGAFLTGDLFNLFVFFEILLAASYGLLLHGSGDRRVAPGLHYIVINLAASLLFLVGVSLIFGVTGTLNMAALAEMVGQVPPPTRSLLHVGASILAVAFLVKAAAWPLGFWLPRAYDAAVPPASAMFAIMTKVGIYALLRLSLLVFGGEAGESAGLGREWLFFAGVATLAVGVVGMLAARDMRRIAGYSLLVSVGTLLGAISFGDTALLAGALFYMFVSTLGAAAFYQLSGLIGPEGGDAFEDPPTLEAYDPEDDGLLTEDDERAVAIPAPIGILSAGFLICTLIIAGIPPLPGFMAKFAMLGPLLQEPEGPMSGAAALLAALLVGSSLLALIAMARAGIQIWWADPGRIPPTIRLGEAAPLGALLFGLLVLTFAIEGPYTFIQRAAMQALAPSQYSSAVVEGEAGP